MEPSDRRRGGERARVDVERVRGAAFRAGSVDRKSTRLNSSHLGISYAVFCLKKKMDRNNPRQAETEFASQRTSFRCGNRRTSTVERIYITHGGSRDLCESSSTYT